MQLILNTFYGELPSLLREGECWVAVQLIGDLPRVMLYTYNESYQLPLQ